MATKFLRTSCDFLLFLIAVMGFGLLGLLMAVTFVLVFVAAMLLSLLDWTDDLGFNFRSSWLDIVGKLRSIVE